MPPLMRINVCKQKEYFAYIIEVQKWILMKCMVGDSKEKFLRSFTVYVRQKICIVKVGVFYFLISCLEISFIKVSRCERNLSTNNYLRAQCGFNLLMNISWFSFFSLFILCSISVCVYIETKSSPIETKRHRFRLVINLKFSSKLKNIKIEACTTTICWFNKFSFHHVERWRQAGSFRTKHLFL